MSAVPPPPPTPPVMPPAPPVMFGRPQATTSTRLCPKCQMEVPAKAYVCAYCKKKLRTSPAVIGCLGIFGGLIVASMFLQSAVSPKSGSHAGSEAKKAETQEQLSPAQVAERAKARREALAKLRKDRDEMKGIDFYYDKNTVSYVNTRSEMFIYIGDKADRDPWLRLKIQYVSNDWIFAKTFLVKADDQTFSITPDSPFEVKRDNGDGKVWEWYERTVTASDYVMLRAIAKARAVTLRYEGQQYHDDRKLSSGERQRIATILDTFELMGVLRARPPGHTIVSRSERLNEGGASFGGR